MNVTVSWTTEAMDEFDETEWKRRELQLSDEARFEGRAERATRTKVHGIIPNHFFSAASSECRELFINGNYYGCISLAQAVAEALVRYLGEFHHIGAPKNPLLRVRSLHEARAISKDVLEAFDRTRGNDRNTFHHINPDLPTDYVVLEKRAEECVAALYTIESEIFAFDTVDGAIAPKNPQYWPREGPVFLVHLRLGG